MRLGVTDSGTIRQQLSGIGGGRNCSNRISHCISWITTVHIVLTGIDTLTAYFIAHTAHRRDVTNTNNTARMCKKIPRI